MDAMQFLHVAVAVAVKDHDQVNAHLSGFLLPEARLTQGRGSLSLTWS